LDIQCACKQDYNNRRSSHATHIRPFHYEVVWNQPAIASCLSAWEPGKRSVVLNGWWLFVLIEHALWNTKNMEIIDALLRVMISWMLIDVLRVLIDALMEFRWAETKSLHFCYMISVIFFFISVIPLISVCCVWWSKKKKEYVKDHSVIIYEHICWLVYIYMYVMIPFIFCIIAANFNSMQFVVCNLFCEHNILLLCIQYTLLKFKNNFDLKPGKVAGFCVCGTEPSAFVNCG
jgi:hypothetical protein